MTHSGTQRPKGGCLPRSEGGDIFPGSTAWAKQQEERTGTRGDLGFAIPAWLPAIVRPFRSDFALRASVSPSRWELCTRTGVQDEQSTLCKQCHTQERCEDTQSALPKASTPADPT